VDLDAADLDRIRSASSAGQWVAGRASEWLQYWNEDVGRAGFYPFDLLAGAYVLDHGLFDCASIDAWIAPDHRLWHLFGSGEALIVGLESERPDDVRAESEVVYCPALAPRTHGWLMGRLARADGGR
jgi:hypothetical protein